MKVKNIASGFVAAMLVCGLLPCAAFADESSEEAVGTASAQENAISAPLEQNVDENTVFAQESEGVDAALAQNVVDDSFAIAGAEEAAIGITEENAGVSEDSIDIALTEDGAEESIESGPEEAAAIALAENGAGNDAVTTLASQDAKCGFSITGSSWNLSGSYKKCGLGNGARQDDGSFDVTFPFYTDQPEEWIDENVTLIVEDVTPTAYKNMFEAVGADCSLSYTIESEADYLANKTTTTYVREPNTENGETKLTVAAQSGKSIIVHAGHGVRVLKASAIIDGEVADCIYLGTGTNTCDIDSALYAAVRHYIESQLWTDDMTNLEKLRAVATYLSNTTHYPNTSYTSKEGNPTLWENWSVDGIDLHENMYQDSVLGAIMLFQGGIGTCTEVTVVRDVATYDLGLPYIYHTDGTFDDGEGVYVGAGSYSSTPSNPYHYSLIYQYENGKQVFIDCQGRGSGTSKDSRCEEHDCASKIISLNYFTDNFTRLSGDDRYSTMEQISAEGFDAADTVVLAAGSNYADALSAMGLAGALGSPVLLSNVDGLSEEAASELARLGASSVYVVGGEDSLSAAVVKELKACGLSVKRVAGEDRYETAAAVYRAGAAVGAWDSTGNGGAKTAIIASGAAFADALSTSSYAWWSASPIFLVGNDGLDADTQNALTQGGFDRIVIVGGQSSVPASVEKLAQGVASTTRLSGADRYATSAAFADWACSQGMTFDNAGIATGKKFPDALAGGALCGSRGSALLLADYNTDGNGEAVTDLLAAHKNDISHMYYFGGYNSVTFTLSLHVAESLFPTLA